MTQAERKLLEQAIKAIKHPGVTAAEYDENFKKTEITPFSEVHRRLNSTDYKLGYEACRDTVNTYLEELLRMGAKKAAKRGPYNRKAV